MLTELQKQRIKHHLGFPLGIGFTRSYTADSGLMLDSLSVTTELIVVGDISIATNPTHVRYQGQLLAAQGSILALTELAYRKINPEDVDASLQVAEVGKVKLRGNELDKREDLYMRFRKELARVLDTKVIQEDDYDFARIGYTDY